VEEMMSDVMASEWADEPILDEADVIGLDPTEVAVAAAATTASDQGSGPTTVDD
jgi:hypothetical protein